MYTEITSKLTGQKLEEWKCFITASDLKADLLIEKTVILWDGDKIAATGSRYNNILKLIAVDPSYRGEDLTSTVISELRRDAFCDGYRSLFLYTKPQNESIFTSLFFHTIAKTRDLVLLEDRKDGIKTFIDPLPLANISGKIASVVMNCNPFTLGHQYLIELAARECDYLYVFVLSEDKSEFSAKDRMEMVKLGTSHLSNVSVVPTGPYLISSATFPTYFLKDRDNVTDVQCRLDIEVFTEYFVPKFGITHRYVGSEPLSAMTNAYNEALKQNLPSKGIELIEIDRKKIGNDPISASHVRKLVKDNKTNELASWLPDTTINYLKEKGYLN